MKDTITTNDCLDADEARAAQEKGDKSIFNEFPPNEWPTLDELLGLDKFDLTYSQRCDCISLANQWGIEAGLTQAGIFHTKNLNQ